MPELAPKMKEKNCLDYNSVEQYIDKLLEKVYTNEERKQIDKYFKDHKYIRQNSTKNFKYEQLNAIIENDNRILLRG